MKPFSSTAMAVLKQRYLKKDESGGVIETPEEMFRRVAKNIATADLNYSASAKDVQLVEKKFYTVIENLDFLPNSPTLMNAGREYQQLAACFVLPIEDSIESIFDTLKQAAIIHQTGGGTGFSFSNLRPKGDPVKASSGVASGPVSFMKIYDAAAEQIKQGGMRRGANMGILRIDHPDIIEFITVKDDPKVFTNFNISVAITDDFMEALEENRTYPLINPRTKKIVRELESNRIFDLLVLMAWKNADPGIVFIDTINKTNPTPHLGKIESTNPCLAGDTLIATADGRMAVSFKQLAEEKKDVPVFTEDNSGKITIRFMRNPRLTGKSFPVYKITLDSGDIIKATADHIFFLRNGLQKKTDELQVNDSLHVLTKSLQLQRGKITVNRHKKYWRIFNRGVSEKSEHTIIAKFFHNNDEPIPEDSIIHHIDFDSMNNSPENLKILKIKDHDQLHGELMRGKQNPIYKMKANPQVWEKYKANNPFYNTVGKYNPRYGVHLSKEIKEKISNSKKLLFGRNPQLKHLLSKRSSDKWNDPKYRENAEKGFKRRALSKLEECKKKTDLRCFLDGNKVMVEKKCEYCEKKFVISFSKREGGFCSSSCAMKFLQTDEKIKAIRNKNMNAKYKTLTEANREKEIEIYLKLKSKLGREPLKKEWENHCKQYSVSFRLGTKFGFKTYAHLKEFASNYNHKVVRIEYLGKEDVYNGTVDDFHNFFIGGFEDRLGDQRKIKFIKTKNCGEVPLLPWEACNLGSINLSNFVKNGNIDYDRLAEIVKVAVHFLDNVIDMSKYPVKQIEKMVKGNRKIGLGVMGFADLLIQLGMKYGTEKSFKIADELMRFIEGEAHKASEELALKRGVFPNYKGSIYDGKSRLRNATLTSIAPTGTISIIAGCSSGIEAIFAVVFRREILDGRVFYDANPQFERMAKEAGFYSAALMEKIAKQGTITNITEIPKEIREIFVTALEVPPEAHVKMQAAFQKHVDNAVSKTVNLPQNATVKDVAEIFKLAYKLNCKGITVYRYGSKEHQVLSVGKQDDTDQKGLNKENKCPVCGANNVIQDTKCSFCKNCGASSCLV